MKKCNQIFIKLPNLRNIISISLLITLMAFLGIIGTANAEDKNVGASSGINSDRKANCKSGGGTVSTSGNTITCTLHGDTGTATVTCVDGGVCVCTGSACDEFGGGDAVDRVKNPRNLRDKFKGAMSPGRAPSQLAPPKPLTPAERARRPIMERNPGQRSSNSVVENPSTVKVPQSRFTPDNVAPSRKELSKRRNFRFNRPTISKPAWNAYQRCLAKQKRGMRIKCNKPKR